MLNKIFELEPKRLRALLNAALKEFALMGFEGASTNVIAKQAGISKALMFHYAGSKQELFLCVYDYFSELLEREYLMKMDFSETDIFKRLRRSYLLQIELLKQHPWIFEFNRLSARTSSGELNRELVKRAKNKPDSCGGQMLDGIDESNFRANLDTAQCKQIILWANVGFTDEILKEIRGSSLGAPDYELIISKLDGYLNELQQIFYISSDE